MKKNSPEWLAELSAEYQKLDKKYQTSYDAKSRARDNFRAARNKAAKKNPQLFLNKTYMTDARKRDGVVGVKVLDILKDGEPLVLKIERKNWEHVSKPCINIRIETDYDCQVILGNEVSKKEWDVFYKENFTNFLKQKTKTNP